LVREATMEMVASADPTKNRERGDGLTPDSNTMKLQLHVRRVNYEP
jgi:hypothetical protein